MPHELDKPSRAKSRAWHLQKLRASFAPWQKDVCRVRLLGGCTVSSAPSSYAPDARISASPFGGCRLPTVGHLTRQASWQKIDRHLRNNSGHVLDVGVCSVHEDDEPS